MNPVHFVSHLLGTLAYQGLETLIQYTSLLR